MNKNKSSKKISWLLMVSMIVSLLSPALSVSAVNRGDMVKIVFDVGDGPDTQFTDNELEGRAGYSVSGEGYDDSDGYEQDPVFIDAPRPRLPGTNPDWEDDFWDGYTFDGWYNEENNRITKVPYAFPYKEVTTYTARWTGTTTDSYDLITKHQTELTLVNGSKKLIELASPTVSSARAGATVSTSYQRTIAGYVYSAGESQPKYRMKYGETPGQGTGSEIGGFSNTNHSFTGTMPNETVTVTYTYVVDVNKKFNFRVEYVDESDNTLAIPDSMKYIAGDAVSAAPKNITGYNVKSTEIVTGDIASEGVYPISETGGNFRADNSYVGRMPNQNVTIKYSYERDPSYTVAVEVLYVDQDGNNLRNEGLIGDDIPAIYTSAPTDSIEIPAPTLTGYSVNYNLRWTSGITSVTKDPLDSTKLFVVPGMYGGTLTIEYLVNLNDKNTWAIVSYQSDNYGNNAGDTSPRYFAKGSYDVDDLTDRITPSAQPNYTLDGWYLADVQGNKQGNKLTTVDLQSDITLISYFVENSADWFDISFAAGNHGSITNVDVQHIVRGTAWNDIAIPTATPNPGYRFDGWFDEQGNQVIEISNPQFVADMLYTARFTPINPDVGHEALNIPDATGRIKDDGRGVISIETVAEDRKYALTDMDGIVMEVQTGLQLRSSQGFTGLDPSTRYKIYELASLAPILNIGTNIEGLDADLRSVPATVRVLALGENFSIGADELNDGLCKVIISPAASNTEYAVVDEHGSPIQQPDGDGLGWVKSEAMPLTAVLRGLDPDRVYTVVARQVGESFAPEDKADLGSAIYTYLIEPEVPYYVIRVINGTIQEVGEETPGSDVYTLAEAGDAVRITADTDASGRSFAGWKILIGEIPGFTSTHETYHSPRFTMPAANIVLVATYEKHPLATDSNATLEYSVNAGHEGEVALNLEKDKEQQLLDELLTPEDETILAEGRHITYRVRYTKRSMTNAEAGMIKDEVTQYEDALRGAWAIDIELLRYIDGERRPVGSDCNLGLFETIAQIDLQDWNQIDYQLWQIKDGVATEISMVPDPNAEPEYMGLFSFDSEIDATYILTYSRTYLIQIKDNIRGIPFSARVRQGDTLENVAEYFDWIPNQDVIDPNGDEWSYAGLSSNAGRYVEYDIATPITRDITVYAYYTSSDPEWEDARRELEKKIQEAEDLKNNGSVSDEDKEKLQKGIDDALEILNKSPRPTTDELIKAKEELQRIIDEVRNGGTDPGPGPGPKPGGNSGGSSGGSSVIPNLELGGSTPRYVTGVDGDWQLIDSQNHKWIFVLKDGNRLFAQWAYISYTVGEKTAYYYYHFAVDGMMDSGWFKDEDGSWYYLSETHDGWFGHMLTGWHRDAGDNKWYYLNPRSGAVMAGWQEIGGKWYYFTAENQKETYQQDDGSGRWQYTDDTGERPWGSMYEAEQTPDGYQVDGNGEWQR